MLNANRLVSNLLNPWRIARILAASTSEFLEIGFVSKGKNFRVTVPSTELWGSIKDILVFDEYELLRPFRVRSLSRNATIVDVGAQVGLYSLKVAPFVRRVVSFEPNVTNYRLLAHNVARNSVSNLYIRQEALWSSKGKVQFSEAGSGFVSELGGVSGDYNVRSVTLDDVINELGIIDLLKMDIEGSEYQTLLSTSSAALKRIDMLVAELHIFKPQHRSLLGQIITKLRDSGLAVTIVRAPFWPVKYGIVKPWHCCLNHFGWGSTNLYRLFLSATSGAQPLLMNAKRALDVGEQALLYAHRS